MGNQIIKEDKLKESVKNFLLHLKKAMELEGYLNCGPVEDRSWAFEAQADYANESRLLVRLISDKPNTESPLMINREDARTKSLDELFLEYAIGSNATYAISRMDKHQPIQPTDKNESDLISAIKRTNGTYMSIASLTLELANARKFDAIAKSVGYILKSMSN